MVKKISYNSKEEWLSLRKGFIGGSDAASVIGLNPYKGAYALWAEKTGKIPEFEGNITTRVGAYLEDLVAKMFTEETGKKVRRENRMLVNDQYPFACADVDRMVVGEDSLLEIKTTNSIPVMKKVRNGEFPETFYCQMMHYLAVSGLKKAYLAVLIECREFKIFELERDEGEIAALMSSEEQFWHCVQTDTPPAADGSESTSDTLSALYPTSNGDTVSLFAYEAELAQYIALTAQIKALEAQRDECANKVKAFMNEAGRGESYRHRVSWTTAERRTFDSKRFIKENPQIDMESYYKTSSYRTFKVTEKE